MGERDNAHGEVTAARARITDLTLELSERLAPEALKQKALIKVGELKDKSLAKADEIRTHAKEAAVEKTMQWGDQLQRSPRGYKLLGTLIGAWVGRELFSRFVHPRIQQRFGGRSLIRERYLGDQRSDDFDSAEPMDRPEVAGRLESAASNVQAKASDVVNRAKEGASSAISQVKEKAGDATEQVRTRVSALAGQVPSPRELGENAGRWYGKVVAEQPVLLGLGAVVIGMAAAALIPVTSKERALIEPVKQKAQEAVTQLGQQVQDRMAPSGAEDHQPESDEGEQSHSADVQQTSAPVDFSGGIH